MAILNQALAAQQPQQQPPPPPPPEMDPVRMLMNEYKRLTPDDEVPARPMFTPEQQSDRIDRNNNLAAVGALGGMSGDRGVRNVGTQVFHQALADRQEQHSARGIVDPLTGEESLDPEYIRARQEDKRGTILQKALAFQQNRMASQDRRDASAERGATLQAIGTGHDDARRDAAAARMSAAGGAGPNLVQIKDDATGESFWANPKTGEYVKPVTKADGSSLVRPAVPTGSDAKELTQVATGKSAVQMGIAAATVHPDAFGPAKGIPDQLGDGVVGNAARYFRDNKQLTPDQLAARAAIYNNVSAVIKERAGTAQSKQELKRLQGFLPGEMDSGPAIVAKLKAFDAYLGERGNAIRSKYNPARPMMNAGGQPAPQGGAPRSSGGGLQFNPATGEIEGGE